MRQEREPIMDRTLDSRPIRLALLAAVAVTTSAQAADFLDPAQLEAELGGKVIKGYYVGSNIQFVEAYQPGGRIAYKDDLKADAGRWFIAGRAFCTFYDRIGGGCWYVIKKSGNCFEFHHASSRGDDPVTRESLLAHTAHARAARDSDQVTCEQWFGS
jgi:hypothetical protein